MVALYKCKNCGTTFTTEAPTDERQIREMLKIMNDAPFARANAPIRHFVEHSCGTPASGNIGIGELVGFTNEPIVP